MIITNQYDKLLHCMRSGLLFLILVFGPYTIKAQVNPPRPVMLITASMQELDFGSFVISGDAGGTVKVDSDGSRDYTGDIVLVGNNQAYGIIRVEVATGTRLFLFTGLGGNLSDGNGHFMDLTLDQETYPAMMNTIYTTTSPSTDFRIGATIHLGSRAANPPGEYMGTYDIIINHE